MELLCELLNATTDPISRDAIRYVAREHEYGLQSTVEGTQRNVQRWVKNAEGMRLLHFRRYLEVVRMIEDYDPHRGAGDLPTLGH